VIYCIREGGISLLGSLDSRTLQRFFDKIQQSRLCWEWTSAQDLHGYSLFWCKQKTRLAHRVSYEIFKGFVPHDLQIDHLCKNKKCVNPDHLELVTPQENMNRVDWKERITFNETKTHCPQGHEYTGKNLLISCYGSRVCKICKLQQSKESKRRARIKKKLVVI